MEVDSDVFSDAHARSYEKGQILLYQGEETENIFLIRKGYVKIYDITSQGNEKLLMILGPKDMFPLVFSFAKNSNLSYFYETFTDSDVCVLPKKDILSAIENDSKFTKHLLYYFVDKTRDLMSRIECIESSSAKHKIAQVLQYLAQAHGEEVTSCKYKVNFPITQQNIADLAGLTRSTTSIHLGELDRSGIFSEKDGVYSIRTDKIESFLTTD